MSAPRGAGFPVQSWRDSGDFPVARFIIALDETATFRLKNRQSGLALVLSPINQIEQRMKKIASIIALVGLLAVPALAADKEVTITGEGECAKCVLHETDKCQTTIQTEENGKKVTLLPRSK